MIQCHQPVERIFDIIDIELMNNEEMRDFFEKTFQSVNIRVSDEAMGSLCYYSAGFPKIMHIIGDTLFWIDKDNVIDFKDATEGILIAAEEIGKKFVDQQVYNELKSTDYRTILEKLGKESPFALTFQKGSMERILTEREKKKFNNFLQRMKKLKVLKSGGKKGEYIFTNRLVRLYMHLEFSKKRKVLSKNN